MQHFEYRAQLDGLRALCIVFTLIAHTPGNHGINGTVGVDVFFALSGYLITSLLMVEKEATGRICLGCFYIRRIFRIVPLYALTIALYLAGAWLALLVTRDARGIEGWWAALPWVASFNSEWRPTSAGATFWHAWTLGIEEKYYVVWPLLFAAAAGGRRLFWLASAAPLFVLMGEYSARGYIGILAGSLGALWVQSPQGKQFVLLVPTHVWASLMCLGVALSTVFGAGLNIFVSLPAVFFIACLLNKPEDVYQRVLSNPLLVRLGALTYAIYLIHRLVGNVVEQLAAKMHVTVPAAGHFVLTLVGSVLGALVLQRLVEKPMIALGKRLSSEWTRRNSRQPVVRSAA